MCAWLRFIRCRALSGFVRRGVQALLEGLDACGDGLPGHGVAEAEVALALRAKDDAGDGGDVRSIEEHGGDLAAVPVDFGDLGEGVEGAFGSRALEAGLMESGDEQIAALAIFLTALVEDALRNVEGLK